jgi:hypothetical protein
MVTEAPRDILVNAKNAGEEPNNGCGHAYREATAPATEKRHLLTSTSQHWLGCCEDTSKQQHKGDDYCEFLEKSHFVSNPKDFVLPRACRYTL